MTTDTALIENREELKRRLAAGEYKTLVDVFLAWTNRMIQRITRRTKPLPLWLMTVLLSLVMGLIFFGAIYVTGDFIIIGKTAALYGLGWTYGSVVLFTTLLITTVIVINQSIHRVSVLWRDEILDATESLTSLHEFEDWLKMSCNLRLHFLVTIFGGLLTSLSLIASATTLLGVFPGYGYAFGVIIPNMFGAASLYQFSMVIFLPMMLRRYDLKLFAADPATSELLSRLSGELSFFVYFMAFVEAITTLVLVALGASQVAGFVLILFNWLLLIIAFILNQTSLFSLVRRAKWKTLNEAQAKIEKLRASKNFGSPKTMDAINKLMDYHDRVKATRNSALNSGAILGFINSLLLPLLAFLLGNLDKLMALLPQRP